MRLLAYILVAGILLSLLKLVLLILCVAFALLLLWGLLTKPGETVGAVVFCFVVGALQRYPVAGFALVASVGAWFLFRRAYPVQRTPLAISFDPRISGANPDT